MPLVAIVMGSKSDSDMMKPALEILDQYGINYEVNVISAHRTPDKAREYASTARERGIEVIIAAAGLAAHLPGVLASWTTVPVIGVPLAAGELKGLDSLYSIVQMPPGIPVACVAIGSPGVKNAAHMAAEILSLKYAEIAETCKNFRDSLKGDIK